MAGKVYVRMARPKTEASADISQLVRGRGWSDQESREDLRMFTKGPGEWYQQRMFHHNDILCISIGFNDFLAYIDNEAGLYNIRQSFEVTVFDSGNETHLGLGNLNFAKPRLPEKVKKFIRLSHISMCLGLSQQLSEGEWQEDTMKDLDEKASALPDSSTDLKNLIMAASSKEEFIHWLYFMLLA